MPCNSEGIRRFGVTCRPHLQGRGESQASDTEKQAPLAYSSTVKMDRDMLLRNVGLSPNHTAVTLEALLGWRSLFLSIVSGPHAELQLITSDCGGFWSRDVLTQMTVMNANCRRIVVNASFLSFIC
jgi:hypothetical protein